MLGRLRWSLLALVTAALLIPGAGRAAGLTLWPLLTYHRDLHTGARALHLLGPLFSYEADGERWSWTLRPLFHRAHAPGVHPDEFSVLYPLAIWRWGANAGSARIFGLVSYQTQAAHDAEAWDRRLTIFPFLFYHHRAGGGTSLSVLPFYADLEHLLGYERVQMVAFPLFLRLREPLVERTWAPFPFVEWTGGTLGRGWRGWPFYGWEEVGESTRMQYALWPLYIRAERYFRRPEREERVIVAPFYARIDSPALHSRAYMGPFVTHTTDTNAQTDTWGFPWPLWVSQRRLDTGERQLLRLAPFYQDQRHGNRRAQFYLWPLYRTRDEETATHRYRRRDYFLVLGRDVEEVDSAASRRRAVHTAFPLWRRVNDGAVDRFSTLALMDALFPRNETIARLYAPLWQLYTSERVAGQPARWSLLWDLVSSDGEHLRYPVEW